MVGILWEKWFSLRIRPWISRGSPAHQFPHRKGILAPGGPAKRHEGLGTVCTVCPPPALFERSCRAASAAATVEGRSASYSLGM